MQAGDRRKPSTLKLNCLSNAERADIVQIAGESGNLRLAFIVRHGIQRSIRACLRSGVHGSSVG
jgi:hypothetical protein